MNAYASTNSAFIQRCVNSHRWRPLRGPGKQDACAPVRFCIPKLMKFQISTSMAGLFAAALFVFTAACGGPGERIKEIEAVKGTPSPTPGEREISGIFNVTGASTNGIDEYTGSLTVTNQGDVYGFRWATIKGTRVGTGVQFGNSTPASYAATGRGKR